MNSAARTGPGRIANSQLGKTLIGELDGHITDRLRQAELPVETTDNVQGHVWQKFILNAAITGLCLGDFADPNPRGTASAVRSTKRSCSWSRRSKGRL